MTGVGHRLRLRALAVLACALQLTTSVCAGAAVVLCLSGDEHAVIELALAGEARCSDGSVRDHCLGAEDGRDCGDVPLLLPAQAALASGGAPHLEVVASPAASASIGHLLHSAPPAGVLLRRGHAPPGALAATHLAAIRLLI